MELLHSIIRQVLLAFSALFWTDWKFSTKKIRNVFVQIALSFLAIQSIVCAYGPDDGRTPDPWPECNKDEISHYDCVPQMDPDYLDEVSRSDLSPCELNVLDSLARWAAEKTRQPYEQPDFNQVKMWASRCDLSNLDKSKVVVGYLCADGDRLSVENAPYRVDHYKECEGKWL